MTTLLQDIRFGARVLLKNRGFTIIAVLTLALGIGGCAAMYAFLDQTVLRGQPYPDLDSLVVLEESDPLNPNSTRGVSISAIRALLAEGSAFEDIGGYQGDGFAVAYDDDLQILNGALVTPNTFEFLGVKPLLGRALQERDAQPGNDDVVVLSERTWRRYFGARPEIVGSTIELSRKLHTVVGVMPEGFWRGRDLFAPFRPPSDASRVRTWARLRQLDVAQQAQAELDVISDRLARDHPETQGAWRLTLRDPFELSGGQLGMLAAFVVAPVGLVFLIACVNIAHLQLGRDLERSREMAVRRALGAGRLRLVRQLLTESLLLALLGGSLGIAFASWGLNAIEAYLPAQLFEPIGSLELDPQALWFLVLLSALSSILFGLLPAVRASELRPAMMLNQGAGRHTSRTSFRNLLVISELTLSMILLAGAGMTIVLVHALISPELGFDEKNLWTARVSLRGPALSGDAPRRNWSTSALEQVLATPGVVSAAFGTELPFTGSERRRLELPARSVSPPAETQVEFRAVSPGYFETLGIALRMGRVFQDNDREGGNPVVIVNETLARQYLTEGVLGKRLRFPREEDPAENAPPVLREVVGVVADVRQSPISGLPPPPIAYVPYRQEPKSPVSLVVRTSSPQAAQARTVLESINAPSQEIFVQSVWSFERQIDALVRTSRFIPVSMAVFAGFGLLLAAVGLYGTTSRAVAQRRQEFGIRQALGARASDVFRLVMRQSTAGGAVGLALGAAGSFAAARLFMAVLEPQERAALGFDLVDASELLVAGLAAATLLIAVILLATYLPARRATKIDPMTALRYE